MKMAARIWVRLLSRPRCQTRSSNSNNDFSHWLNGSAVFFRRAYRILPFLLCKYWRRSARRRRVSARMLSTGTGAIDRSQQRKHRALWGRGNDHFVAVAVNPTIVFGITPGSVPVHARRDFASLAVLPMPRRSGSGHETLVHRRVLRIGHSFGDGSLALTANRHAEEPMGAAVAEKIGG